MRLALGFTVAVLALGCTSPQYQSGHLQCASGNKACPQDFYCAADDRCWATGSAPDMTMQMTSPPDLAPFGTLDMPLGPRDLAGTPSLCSSAGALFCDGFESGMVDSASWTQSANGGTATIDSTHVFRGHYALHSHTDATPMGADHTGGLLTHRGLPITGTIYVRTWAYFASPLSSEFNQFLNLVDGNTGGTSFSLRNGDAVDNDYTPPTGAYKESTLPVPTDQWTCIRMSISGQSATGTTGDIHLYIDGVEASAAQALAAPIAQTVGVAVGIEMFDPAADVPAQEAWFDELIIDDKPIGCTE